MKKINAKHIIMILIVLFVLSAVVLWFLMDKREDRDNSSEKDKVEKVKEDDSDKEKDPTVIRRETETVEGEISNFKYGVKKQPVTYNTYDVYSDGTRVLVSSVDDMIYYHTGYRATTEELKVESEANASYYLSYYEELLQLVNKEREKAGVAPVVLDTTLCQIAGLRAAEMEYSGKFSHERPDGTGCFKVTTYYGYSYKYLAENIAQGYRSPAEVVKVWKSDATDYSYMINPKFTKMGVGFSDAGINCEWVQVFAD